MKLPLYQVDAFASGVFTGNPAAVVPLEVWPDDRTLQQIAEENNLSETAFFAPCEATGAGGDYRLRWFTPLVEVDLCGHATLAAAHVLFTHREPGRTEVVFVSRGGRLSVCQDGDLLRMTFPRRPGAPCDPPPGLVDSLGGSGARPRAALRAARDVLLAYDREEDVRALAPTFDRLAALDVRAVIVTAPGRNVDFVSRFFAPSVGIAEDPVTGSAHTTLVPYWAERLDKAHLHALQVSRRGGELFCEDQPATATVQLAGRAVPYLSGTIEI